jgi:hypothetical protein
MTVQTHQTATTALLAQGRKKNGATDYTADWLPVAAAADALRVSPQTVYNYINRNEVRSKNRGGKTLVLMEDARQMAAQKHARFPVPATSTPAPPAPAPETTTEEPMTTTTVLTPPPDRLTLARQKIDRERGELAEARHSREEQIERLRGELELLLVRESELDDALSAIETIERLGV